MFQGRENGDEDNDADDGNGDEDTGGEQQEEDLLMNSCIGV